MNTHNRFPQGNARQFEFAMSNTKTGQRHTVHITAYESSVALQAAIDCYPPPLFKVEPYVLRVLAPHTVYGEIDCT